MLLITMLLLVSLAKAQHIDLLVSNLSIPPMPIIVLFEMFGLMGILYGFQ